MSLFDKIFGDSKHKDSNAAPMDWVELTDIVQMDDLVVESSTRPVFIFKHSTRCNISRMALKQFEQHYKIPKEDATAYFLDILQHRDISNEIAERFKVIHQSPQLLLIRNAECFYTTSHSEIDAEELQVKVAEMEK